MKTKSETENQVLTADLRERLKIILKSEIERLPETLKSLEPKVRIDIVCKLIPFVLPKVESVSPTAGEPFQLDF